MKSFLLALTAALVGTTAGVSYSLWRFGLPSAGDPYDLSVLQHIAVDGLPPLPALGGTPRLEARIKDGAELQAARDDRPNELVVDFGVMPQMASNQAEFIFRNNGDGVLELRKGDSSCKCMIGQFSGAKSSDSARMQLNPGEETVITLAWKTEGQEGPFRHRAEIRSNDPARPIVNLVVNGTLTRGIHIAPRTLTLGRIGYREGKQVQFDVVAFHSDDLEIRDISLIDAAAPAGAPPDPLAKLADISRRKLSLEEVQAVESQAKSGYRVTVTLKPGLPLGRIDRKIRVTTNRIEPVELPLVGTVAGDISVAEGGAWIAQQQFFHLGQVQSEKGTSKQLSVIVSGKGARNVQVKVKETKPPALAAEIGTPRPVGETEARSWPITILIPAGTRAMSHADKGEYGKIILETTHPDHKEFVIDVSFLVIKAQP